VYACEGASLSCEKGENNNLSVGSKIEIYGVENQQEKQTVSHYHHKKGEDGEGEEGWVLKRQPFKERQDGKMRGSQVATCNVAKTASLTG